MGFQSTIGAVAGTAMVWNSAGGSGGGGTITGTSLASVATRQGTKSSSILTVPPGGTTAVLPGFLRCELQVQMTSAPVVGEEVDLYLGFSSSATAGTANPAGLTGADAAGPNVDTFGQMVLAGGLILSANLTTGAQFAYLSDVTPLDLYFSPVIYNGSTKAFDGTAAHTILTITPYWWEAQL